MNKLLNAKLGIFAATVTLLFAIFAYLIMNFGFAWFADNRDVYANGFTVSVHKGHSLEAYLLSYPVIDINTETNEYTMERVEGSESYTLPIDDEHSISYSKYKKALVVVVNVKADEASSIRIELNAIAGLETISGNNNYISNCIQISTATLNSDGDVATKGNITDSFVTIEDTPTKKNGINLGEYEVPVGTTEICFIIEYDTRLLKYIGGLIMNNNSGNALVEYSNDIKFYIHLSE